MRSSVRDRLLLGVIASLAVHAAVVLTVERPERPAGRAGEPLEFVELAVVEAVVAEPRSEAETGAVTESGSVAESVSAAEAESETGAVTKSGSVPESVSVTESESATEPVRVSAARLTPRAVALSQVDPLAGECAPADSRIECAVRLPAPSTAPGERLQDDAERAAATVPHLAPRPAPRLRRHHDGTRSYDGHAFVATVHPDGHVSFEDKDLLEDAVIGPLLDIGTPEVVPKILAVGIALSLPFDLTDTIEKHVLEKEIYSSEKRWFLEQTRELRHQLEAEYRDAELARGLHRLRGRLLIILEDDGRTPVERRRAIFALWDECSGDEVGRQAQRTIEAFVRAHMPRGSELAYSDAELATLNAGRASAAPFAPYQS
ncbi:MAG: hypothetical protein OXT09_24075 [Myxococcales bacterium]|nr:hypothetical protein [Myxococcales bacterium]